MPNDPPSFSESEVEAILGRAIERAESGKTSLSLDELVAVGAELGVSRAAIETAAAEVRSVTPPPNPSEGAPESAHDGVKALKARARAAWFRHLFVYLAVNAFLLFVNLMTSPHKLWVVWPLAGWGLGVVLSARRAFFMSEDEAQHYLSRKERNISRKERRRERREARRSATHGMAAPLAPAAAITSGARVDDAHLRARIDQRVDALLAQRGVRVEIPIGRDETHGVRELEDEEDEGVPAPRGRQQQRR